MAAMASDSKAERRESSFLDAGSAASAAENAKAKSEWSAMASGERLQYNDGPPSEDEARQLVQLRESLEDVCSVAPLKDQPENVSEFKLLRFLRGYEGDISAAEAAYREMVEFRKLNNVDELRSMVLSNGGSSPHLFEEFAPLLACIDKGIRHQYGIDDYGNLLTVTDIGALDLRAIVKAGLQDLYVRFCLMTEEYGNIVLHDLSTKAGKLIARHDVINVVNFGFFQWNKACYDLISPIFEGGKHYPESVRKITSCGNGSVAVAAWQVMKHFIPERTKKKLRVLGTNFVPDLLTEIPLHHIPLAWGGAGFGHAFDEAWTQKTVSGGGPNTVLVRRRDSLDIKVGVLQGSKVMLSVLLQGYTIGVSTWFAPVPESSASVSESGILDEAKRSTAASAHILEFDALADPTTMQSSDGRTTVASWVAPVRGIFKVRFDNSFSFFRSKTVKLWLTVDDDKADTVSEKREEEEEDQVEAASSDLSL